MFNLQKVPHNFGLLWNPPAPPYGRNPNKAAFFGGEAP